MLSSLLALAILAVTGAQAAPVDSRQVGPNNTGAGGNNTGAGGVTAAQLLAVMPTSSTCASTTECRTAEQAAPFVSKSFTDFGITSKAEQAALIGIMAFESGEFKFNTNRAGVTGQGTRNMQSGKLNLKYARALPELASQLAATGTADLNAVRALVLPDQFSFGSAAWFLTSQCTQDDRAQLQTGTQAGWAQYITSCVSVAPGPRQAYWQAAVNALA